MLTDTHKEEQTLFGIEKRYIPIKNRFGVYPLSIWELPNDQRLKKLKDLVDDKIGKVEWGNWNTLSEFSPLLAELIVTGYTFNNDKIIFDPFAGRGTRGLIAGFNGFDYLGVDIGDNYVEADNQRAKYHNLDNKVKYIKGDSRYLDNLVNNDYADMIYTCPPYFNLETYNNGVGDLSLCKNYNDFLQQIDKVVKQCFRILKKDKYCIWVVAPIRKGDDLLDFRGDCVKIFKNNKFLFFDDIVMTFKGGLKMMRLGSFDKNRKTVKSHEYILVFKK